MPASLQQILLAPDVRPQVTADANDLIEQEVKDKSGISGTGLKIAYKTATTFAPGHVKHMVDTLLPNLAIQLQPYWDDFNASGGHDFGDYLTKRGDEVAEALLEVSDARAARSGRPVIVRAYKSVRGGASKHIVAALPRIGDLVMRYAG